MKSPIRYFGGKGHFVKKILPLIPTHKYYLEPFFGGGSVFFAKQPVEVEIINDVDENLINLYRVLRDKEKFAEFQRLVSLTLYSRAEREYCLETVNEEKDEIKKAYKFFILARQSFSGKVYVKGWSFNVTKSARNMASTCSCYLSAIDRLPAIHDRLSKTQIECKDFRWCLQTYNDTDYFCYIDPPYISNTRRGGKYENEMTDDDHRELVELLLNYKGKVMVSGYEHEIYEPLLKAGWAIKKYEVACDAVGRTKHAGLKGAGVCAEKNQMRTECLYMNYHRQKQCFEKEDD